MRVSLRSMLIAGVSTLAVSSIAVAPVRPVPEQPVPQISAPVQLTAAVAPLTPTDVASALTEINAIADELDMPLAVGDVAVQNAASDFVDWVYEGILEWTDYFALELAPWALGWIPFGGYISDQIYALYPPFIDFTDSIVYDLVDPVLNDPLNLAVWADGLSAVAYTAVASLLNAGINEINLVIDYFLGWLPPLPPIPPWPPFPTAVEASLAAPTDVAAQALLPGLIGGPVTAVSDVAAGLAHSLVNLWYPPSGVVDGGVGFVSNVLGGFSWLPLVGVADFQLNEVWGLIHTGGNTLAEFANDLIDIANDLVANTVQDGLAPALEDAFYTALLSVQTHGGAAFDAVKNFTLDQVQYLTGVWVPHTTSPRVDLPQGPPDEIRFTVPEALRDVLGPLAGLVPSGQLGSVPLRTDSAASDEVETVVADTTDEVTDAEPETTEPETTEPESTEPETAEPETTDPETTEPDETQAADDGDAEDAPRVGKRDRASSYTSGRDKTDAGATDKTDKTDEPASETSGDDDSATAADSDTSKDTSGSADSTD